jgi:hypothetical protein
MHHRTQLTLDDVRCHRPPLLRNAHHNRRIRKLDVEVDDDENKPACPTRASSRRPLWGARTRNDSIADARHRCGPELVAVGSNSPLWDQIHRYGVEFTAVSDTNTVKVTAVN